MKFKISESDYKRQHLIQDLILTTRYAKPEFIMMHHKTYEKVMTGIIMGPQWYQCIYMITTNGKTLCGLTNIRTYDLEVDEIIIK